MKRGEGAAPRPGAGMPTWKERLVSQRHADKQVMDGLMNGEKLAMVGVTPASEEDVIKLSTLMNTRILTGHNWAGGKLFPVDLCHGQAQPIWYRLFRKIDPFGNGVFTFKQLLHCIREELLISEEEWSDDHLRTVTHSPPPTHQTHQPNPPTKLSAPTPSLSQGSRLTHPGAPYTRRCGRYSSARALTAT